MHSSWHFIFWWDIYMYVLYWKFIHNFTTSCGLLLILHKLYHSTCGPKILQNPTRDNVCLSRIWCLVRFFAKQNILQSQTTHADYWARHTNLKPIHFGNKVVYNLFFERWIIWFKFSKLIAPDWTIMVLRRYFPLFLISVEIHSNFSKNTQQICT